MSSSSRSKGSARNSSSAMRPFSALVTRWPCSSRLRASSSRLTLLSSATSSRAPACSATGELLQRGGSARVVGCERVDRRAVGDQPAEFEGTRLRAELAGAERVAVRLERMRRAPKALGAAGGLRAAQLVEHPRRLFEKGRDELADELGARGRLQLAEHGRVDDGCRTHLNGPRARWPGSAPAPAARRGSAWS